MFEDGEEFGVGSAVEPSVLFFAHGGFLFPALVEAYDEELNFPLYEEFGDPVSEFVGDIFDPPFSLTHDFLEGRV